MFTLHTLKKLALPVATLLGLLSGWLGHETVFSLATLLSDLFINLLKLVSLPIIFLSIISTATSMESVKEMKTLGVRVVKYTLLTTIIAASVALGLFVLLDPVRGALPEGAMPQIADAVSNKGYLSFLLAAIPSNIVQPFLENSVIGVLILAMLISFAAVSLPNDKQKVLHTFFSALYAAIMKITGWIISLMPLAIWAFVTLFVKDLNSGLEAERLVLYLTAIVFANLIQAFIVLPLFLKARGLSPIALFRAMSPALSVAFFSKSSAAALPMAIRSAEERGGVSPKVAGFSLPLCTTINMNACAAFILITVLFVSMSSGVVFSVSDMLLWIVIATIAAIGNAGVPMGCFFLATAFLAAMDVPLNVLGVILPFYSLLDMLESAINVWSDSCVTAIVDREVKESELLLNTP